MREAKDLIFTLRCGIADTESGQNFDIFCFSLCFVPLRVMLFGFRSVWKCEKENMVFAMNVCACTPLYAVHIAILIK